jgi:hypothetical protein
MALTVVRMFLEWELRTLHRAHDLGEGDLDGRPREHVPAAHPALRPHQAGAFHREQDLLEVRLRQ